MRVADFAGHFHGHPITRDARVGTTTADALLTVDGQPCYVEIDNTGNMTRKQMEAKWVRYGRVDGFILVVAMTEARMERLRQWVEAPGVKEAALFTTFERLRGGRPWVDCQGNTVVI